VAQKAWRQHDHPHDDLRDHNDPNDEEAGWVCPTCFFCHSGLERNEMVQDGIEWNEFGWDGIE